MFAKTDGLGEGEGAATPRNASTVVLLRESEDGIETLLLKRNKALMFAGGFWVFPGGSLDPEDIESAGGNLDEAARIAAAREALEESGLEPHREQMLHISHWLTPEVEPKRFATWFFIAPIFKDQEVQIDGSEIHESQWININKALEVHAAGELGILPPTYITLARLARYHTISEMLAAEREAPVTDVFPVIGKEGGVLATMYEGDAGYESGDPATPGPRNRCTFNEGAWQYHYTDVDASCPNLICPV